MKKRQSKSNPAIQLLDKGMIRVDDRAVPYRLNRSHRARYLRLTINRLNEVVLTLPAGCSLDRGLNFMKTKSEWLQRHLRQVGQPETLHGFLKRRGSVAMNGGEVPIDWREAPKALLRFAPRTGRICIDWDTHSHGEAELKSLLRQFAAETLADRTRELAARHGLPVNQVSVRDQLSRWGSCSVKRNISLNWRLVLLPPEIKDYVIWHELAHLVEMNHSHRFWKVLVGFDPQARYHDNVLSKITNRIMAIGRSAD